MVGASTLCSFESYRARLRHVLFRMANAPPTSHSLVVRVIVFDYLLLESDRERVACGGMMRDEMTLNCYLHESKRTLVIRVAAAVAAVAPSTGTVAVPVVVVLRIERSR